MSYRAAVIAFLGIVFVATAASAAEPTAKAPAAPTTSAPEASQATPAPATSRAVKKPSPSATASSATAPPASPHGAMPPTSQGTKSAPKAPAKPEKKVDLNNASLAELQTLPTIGEAEAKKIMANRPYKSKGELVTKAGLPQGVYQAVRYKVEMQKPRNPAPKK